MARRYYSSTAARTTLASGVDDTTTTLSVVAVSGWPASYPYTLVIDQDTVNEELVEVSARTGTTLTVTRGVDGTSAVAHDAGAAVNHGVSARDFDEPNAFINGTGTVTETLLASGAVTEAKLGTGAVTSAKILDGTIVNADINASAAIAQSKVADLTSDLASKLPYSYGTATPTTTDSGFLWYDSNSTPPVPKYWDGSSFATLAPAPGLELITTETPSAVSSVSLNNCFTSDYENYLLYGTIIASSGSNTLYLRFRSGGVDDTANNYITQGITATTTSVSASRTSVTNSGSVGAYSTIRSSFAVKFFGPNVSATTNWHSESDENGDNIYFRFGRTNATTQFDGFSLIAGGGTFTGTLRLYGLKD